MQVLQTHQTRPGQIKPNTKHSLKTPKTIIAEHFLFLSHLLCALNTFAIYIFYSLALGWFPGFGFCIQSWGSQVAIIWRLQVQNIMMPKSKKMKWAVLFERERWNTLSIAVILANHGRLCACVCGCGRITLSSECDTRPLSNEQQVKKMQSAGVIAFTLRG